jgi:hypothetical protein
MDNIIDLIAQDAAAAKVSDEIKDILYGKAAEKIDQFRPNVAKSMFDQSESEEEEQVETEIDQEPQEDQE